MENFYEHVIIGGGFFGSVIASFLKKKYKTSKVLIIEKEKELGKHATYNNQARIHNGYHYPRSITTALRSHINYDRFKKTYKESVFDDFEAYYGVGNINSKVTAGQFKSFCERIGSPIGAAPTRVRDLFNPKLIEDVFSVDEIVFNADKLMELVESQMKDFGVEVFLGTKVTKIDQSPNGLSVEYLKEGDEVKRLEAKKVYNVTYSGINKILSSSGLPLVPLKYEMTEMCLASVPPELTKVGVTVMDGPFFSLLPFPPRGLHTVSHVRYTPHYEWSDSPDLVVKPYIPKSNFQFMLKDIERYMPIVGEIKYESSLFEIKALLPKNEANDGRPILFVENWGLPGLTCILGGKIDNIFDVLGEMGIDENT
ncbi:MAG: FAD-dependent oxidoreductase [Minisyncoccia bacterium]